MICVYGIWHLGAVTAACLADLGFETVGLPASAELAADLRLGKPPLYEPGLAELISKGVAVGRLDFTARYDVVKQADLVWVTFDTPVDDSDIADVEFVLNQVQRLFDHLKDGAVVLISSQLPVGSTALLESAFSMIAAGRRVSFACSPENLRLGQALDTFLNPKRIVVGVREERAKEVLAPVMTRICPNILWMGVESAEMVKHALNTFLATSIVLTNEMATISERVGADFSEIERALRLDPRIGQHAYVRAGSAFGGGTLARDVKFLEALAAKQHLNTPTIGSVLRSNEEHRDWVLTRLKERVGSLEGKSIGLLGLAYKAGTDSIRRSSAIQLGDSLAAAGCTVKAFDPKVRKLPPRIGSFLQVTADVAATFADSDAVVIGTEWPEFRVLPIAELMATARRQILIDQNGFLDQQVQGPATSIEYLVLGRSL